MIFAGQLADKDGTPPLRCLRLPFLPSQCTPDSPPSSARSWFYDTMTSECRLLPFAGCDLAGKNENNFETLEECQLVCVRQKGLNCHAHRSIDMLEPIEEDPWSCRIAFLLKLPPSNYSNRIFRGDGDGDVGVLASSHKRSVSSIYCLECKKHFTGVIVQVLV